jgi:hypothetical protein
MAAKKSNSSEPIRRGLKYVGKGVVSPSYPPNDMDPDVADRMVGNYRAKQDAVRTGLYEWDPPYEKDEKEPEPEVEPEVDEVPPPDQAPEAWQPVEEAPVEETAPVEEAPAEGDSVARGKAEEE